MILKFWFWCLEFMWFWGMDFGVLICSLEFWFCNIGILTVPLKWRVLCLFSHFSLLSTSEGCSLCNEPVLVPPEWHKTRCTWSCSDSYALIGGNGGPTGYHVTSLEVSGTHFCFEPFASYMFDHFLIWKGLTHLTSTWFYVVFICVHAVCWTLQVTKCAMRSGRTSYHHCYYDKCPIKNWRAHGEKHWE